MKILYSVPALAGICFLQAYSALAAGQYDDDVSKNFVPFVFDQVHRGSYNISKCVQELLNCWEVIKPEWICVDKRFYESVCGIVRDQCTDARYWISPDLAPIAEGYCD